MLAISTPQLRSRYWPMPFMAAGPLPQPPSVIRNSTRGLRLGCNDHALAERGSTLRLVDDPAELALARLHLALVHLDEAAIGEDVRVAIDADLTRGLSHDQSHRCARPDGRSGHGRRAIDQDFHVSVIALAQFAAPKDVLVALQRLRDAAGIETPMHATALELVLF